MYSTTSVFDDLGFVINLIVQLLLLIVFLRMAWNVGLIRKRLVRNNLSQLEKDAELLEFKNKKEEAADLYLDYIFIILKTKGEAWSEREKEADITKKIEKIESLGGYIPKSIEKYKK